MKNSSSIIAFFAGCFFLIAQPDSLAPVHSVLDTNNIKFTTMANGDMGWDYTGRTMRAPKESETGYLYASSLWLASRDMYGNLHVAANEFNQDGLDFWAGPFADNYDADYDEKYNRSWLISSDQIEYHRAHFTETGYEMVEVIENWPGNGDVTNGESAQLAPYYDANTNGIYEPHYGDFPLIRGDKAVFVMYNEDREEHVNSGGVKIGAEIHMMLYAYDSTLPELDNSVLVHYEVFNRGSNNFYEFYAGMWDDWDLGAFNDDLIACDTSRNVSIVYNGDNSDETVYSVDSSYIFNGYGNNPPAAGLVSLNEDMYVHWYWNNNFDPMIGNPQDPEHYFNYLNGLWKNGLESGFSRYRFNAQLEDTTDLDFGPNTPNERKSLHGIFIPTFLPGESFCLDFAYVYARNTSYTAKENAVLLMDYVDDVQFFYDDHFSSCTDHTADFDGLSIGELSVSSNFELIKDVDGGSWVLRDESVVNSIYTVQLVNTLGQLVYNVPWNSENELSMNLRQFTSGVYYVHIIEAGIVKNTLPLVKE